MKYIVVIGILVSSIFAVCSCSTEKPKPTPQNMEAKPKKATEDREKMAVAHEKMVACLRSDKPVKECHEELMKECKDSMGKEGCHMMEMKKHRGGKKDKS